MPRRLKLIIIIEDAWNAWFIMVFKVVVKFIIFSYHRYSLIFRYHYITKIGRNITKDIVFWIREVVTRRHEVAKNKSLCPGGFVWVNIVFSDPFGLECCWLILWVFLEFSGGLEVSLANSYRAVIFKPLGTFRAFNIVIRFPQIGEEIAFFCSYPYFRWLADDLKVTRKYCEFTVITTVRTDKKGVCHVFFDFLYKS